MKVSVVIPAFNEERTIAEAIARIRKADVGGHELEIVAVDDGSKDGTREVLSSIPGIRVVAHPSNRGKGAAVKTGFAAATGDVLLISDADLEYDPADFKEVIRPIVEGRADAVLGSRFVHQRPVFFFGKPRSPFFTHYIGNIAIVLLTNVLYGQRATDYEGGTKAFRKALIDGLPIEADGFEYDNELVCKLLRRRARVAEAAIRYRPRSYEQGKKIKWKDGLVMLWTIAKWRFKGF